MKSRSQNKTILTTFFFKFINYNIIIVQVRYIAIETKDVSSIGYNRFPFGVR
jgi:hypothetical protein